MFFFEKIKLLSFGMKKQSISKQFSNASKSGVGYIDPKLRRNRGALIGKLTDTEAKDVVAFVDPKKTKLSVSLQTDDFYLSYIKNHPKVHSSPLIPLLEVAMTPEEIPKLPILSLNDSPTFSPHSLPYNMTKKMLLLCTCD